MVNQGGMRKQVYALTTAVTMLLFAAACGNENNSNQSAVDKDVGQQPALAEDQPSEDGPAGTMPDASLGGRLLFSEDPYRTTLAPLEEFQVEVTGDAPFILSVAADTPGDEGWSLSVDLTDANGNQPGTEGIGLERNGRSVHLTLMDGTTGTWTGSAMVSTPEVEVRILPVQIPTLADIEGSTWPGGSGFIFQKDRTLVSDPAFEDWTHWDYDGAGTLTLGQPGSGDPGKIAVTITELGSVLLWQSAGPVAFGTSVQLAATEDPDVCLSGYCG